MKKRTTIHLAVFVFLTVLVITVLTAQAPSAHAAGPEDEGESVFVQKCNSCHTIGGGKLVGPDLKAVTQRRDREWLVRFIVSPDGMIAQGDPVAKQLLAEYGFPMPNMGVTREAALGVLAYIDKASGLVSQPPPTSQPLQTSQPPQTSQPGQAPQPTPAGQPTPGPQAAQGNVADGRDLFTGRRALENGGPACMSCHNVNGVGIWGGGTVGKDLTAAYSAFGETGIGLLLKTAPFPMMKEVYSAKLLSDAEIADVTAFLKEASGSPATSTQSSSLFFIISAAGALLVIGMFQLLWRGRLSGVRRPLVKGGSK